jgi:AbiV family abortive infection protein
LIIVKGEVMNLAITPELRDEMVSFIRKRIILNLEATKRLLEFEDEDYDDICAGLQTYAIEEYGKLLFLKGLNPSPLDNKIRFANTHNKQGFRDHDHKFELALKDKDLSNSAKVLSEGDFVPDDFVFGDFNMGSIPDMKARMALFYADFKDENSILDPPSVDRPVLKNAVDKFLTHMRDKVL